MKTLSPVLAVVIAIVLTLPAHGDTGDDLAANSGAKLIGQLAPHVKITTLEAKSIDVSALAEHKPVYLEFWATWCVPCRQQMPHLQRAYDDFGNRVQFVAINLGLNDSEADVRDYRERLHLSVPMAIDTTGNIAQTFNVAVTPTHVVIGRDGRIAYVGHSANAQLDAALMDAASDQPKRRQPDRATKPAVGSSAQATSDAQATKALGLLDAHRRDSTKPIVVAFFATWCESYLKESRPNVASACARTRKVMTQLSKTAHEKIDLLAVAGRVWTTNSDVEEYRRANRIDFTLMLDAEGTLFDHYRIRNIPTVIVMDARGIERDRFDGGRDDLQTLLERWIKS